MVISAYAQWAIDTARRAKERVAEREQRNEARAERRDAERRNSPILGRMLAPKKLNTDAKSLGIMPEKWRP